MTEDDILDVLKEFIEENDQNIRNILLLRKQGNFCPVKYVIKHFQTIIEEKVLK